VVRFLRRIVLRNQRSAWTSLFQRSGGISYSETSPNLVLWLSVPLPLFASNTIQPFCFTICPEPKPPNTRMRRRETVSGGGQKGGKPSEVRARRILSATTKIYYLIFCKLGLFLACLAAQNFRSISILE